jgi:glycine dehydrogenase subunit 2
MRNRQATQLISELSHDGRRAAEFPRSDVPDWPLEDLIPINFQAHSMPKLPELAEPDVVRHFVNLSTLNMSVDTHFYPLGSCTMKYNPKRHERLSRSPGIVDIHPHQTAGNIQGLLELLYEMQHMLAEISGLPAVSLQPAAGAHGELTALFVAAAYFRDRGEHRTKVIFPASAHGTNPASAAMAGFECIELKGTVATPGEDPSKSGFVDLEELKRHVDDKTAVFMVTNPNTLGLFEKEIAAAAKIVHDAGGLVYIDGANMNAIMGITRPGDFGGDMMHYNVHKTFTGPHGAGGPGSGPICVRDFLADYLPGPRVCQRETDSHEKRFDLVIPDKTIGRVRSFFGNVGILVRGYCYLRTLGAAGVRSAAEMAILNANYLKEILADVLPSAHGKHCLHEFVASAEKLSKERGITAMDIAKRLLDFGFHPPTVYFPLVVPDAMMFEPTETESKATLDAFSDAIHKIVAEESDLLHSAPHSAPVSRPEEVKATRSPVLTWPILT